MKQNLLPVQELTMDKDTLNFWKAEVRSSLKRQKSEFIDRINYNELVRYFEALQFKGASSLLAIVDEFSPAIISIITSVYYQNPTVQVEAANPDADQMITPSMMYLIQHPEFKPFNLIDLMKGSLTYGMTKSGMKEEMQIGTFDLLVAGFAAIEMNHSSINQEAPTEDASHPVEDMAQNMMQSMIDGAKGLMDKITGSKNPEETE